MAKFNINNYLEQVDGEGFRKAYRKLFDSLNLENVYSSDVLVICKTEKFEKLGRKCFPKKATETEFSVYDTEHYLNCVTGKLFFHDRVGYAYTTFGNIPRTFTCVNPSGDTKITRTFTYIDIAKLSAKGGYREKAILDNLSLWECNFADDGNHKVLELVGKDGNTCDYCLDLGRFTN